MPGRSGSFVCAFAAGQPSGAVSGVWRIWAGKNTPDLYITSFHLGGHIKASVHCPRPDKPTWKRHFGFTEGAKGEVAESVFAAGGSRHKVDWTGAMLGPHCTLEWRIFIQASALEDVAAPVPGGVTLIPPPTDGQCLVIAVILGPVMETTGHPRQQDLDTHLLAEGRLSDGRRVWITYVYTAPGAVTFPEASKPIPVQHVSEEALRAAQGGMRAFAIMSLEDGSLGFWDARVEDRRLTKT